MKVFLIIVFLIFPAATLGKPARPKKHTQLHCATAKCTEKEMKKLIEAGAIPPARPYKPCPPDVCAQGDRLPANGCGCP